LSMIMNTMSSAPAKRPECLNVKSAACNRVESYVPDALSPTPTPENTPTPTTTRTKSHTFEGARQVRFGDSPSPVRGGPRCWSPLLCEVEEEIEGPSNFQFAGAEAFEIEEDIRPNDSAPSSPATCASTRPPAWARAQAMSPPRHLISPPLGCASFEEEAAGSSAYPSPQSLLAALALGGEESVEAHSPFPERVKTPQPAAGLRCPTPMTTSQHGGWATHTKLPRRRGRRGPTSLDGDVFEGSYGSNSTVVAIRQVAYWPEMPHDKIAVENLQQAVVTLSRMPHHTVLAKYLGSECAASGEADGHHVLSLISEWAGAQDGLLSQQLEQRPLGDATVRICARQICEALCHLHEHNACHQRLQPSRVHITEDGRVYLREYGLRVDWGTRDGFGDGTWGPDIGTHARYLPPEMLDAKGASPSSAADTWALGCVVYEMLTQQQPWSDKGNNLQLLFTIVNSNDPPAIPESLCEDASDMILQCFVRNPEERPLAAALLEHAYLSSPPRWSLATSCHYPRGYQRRIFAFLTCESVHGLGRARLSSTIAETLARVMFDPYFNSARYRYMEM